MNRYKILIFSLVITTTLSYATPEFAREYSVSCSTVPYNGSYSK